MSTSNLVSCLLLFLIVFLPSQLGRHFWPGFSLVNGIRVDYLSPTLYLTDILVFTLIIIFLFDYFLKQKDKDTYSDLKIGFLVFLGLILFSPLTLNIGAHLYGGFKVFEFFTLFCLLRRVNLSYFLKFLLLSLMLLHPAILAIAQFINQESVGGAAFLLGERSFSLATPGIAKESLGGKLFLRPYASFSHPNSLAGFLLVGWLLLLDSFKKLDKKDKKTIQKALFFSASVLMALALVLTGSKTVWATAGLLLLVWLSRAYCQQWFFSFLIGSVLLLPAFMKLGEAGLINFIDRESLMVRNELFSISLNLFKERPIFGVGIKNFIPHLADYQLALTRSWLQPVHNIFWLVLAETGAIGLFILLWFLKKSYVLAVLSKNEFLSLALAAVLLTGANDHYWLTLQQNQLLLTFLLAWIFNNKKK